MKRKKRVLKKKNPEAAKQPKPRPKNRYMRNAKLSEYRFLKILRGFAYGLPPKAVAEESGISEKTIRATFDALRLKVREAAMSGKDIFGFGSRYLFEDGQLTEKGTVFLESVAKSRLFKSYMAEHAPRLKDDATRELYVFDLGMRIFAGLIVAEDEFMSLSPEMERALGLLDAMKIWIEDRQDTPGFNEEHSETITRYRHLSRMAEIVVEQNQIIALRQSGQHSYPGRYFYEDLKRYLLKESIN